MYSSPFFCFLVTGLAHWLFLRPVIEPIRNPFLGGIMSWNSVEWILCNVEKIRMHWSNVRYADTYQLPLFRPFRLWNGLGSKSERQALSPTWKRTASFGYYSLALLLYRPRACWLPPIVAAQHSSDNPPSVIFLHLWSFTTIAKVSVNRNLFFFKSDASLATVALILDFHTKVACCKTAWTSYALFYISYVLSDAFEAIVFVEICFLGEFL